MTTVKGGSWTNIEDEILKASVSKYGLNQWARVSSLLSRKSAKQCKARWQEWLDPAIVKIDWSKEEDERLLHLAKLMPTQWRTIAPIVGRSALQCLQRYTKLLDDAERRENNELGLTGPEGGESLAPTADDIRKMRAGEQDPDPESKPALPDAVDMDEDEKEMLSEARARLANTKGKKAKRKARERQLEESRRLALLQKRRELKSTGINIKISNRKPGQMDYNADIPFERAPAPGFHDTQAELERNEREREAFDPRKRQLVNKRKQDAEDEQGDDNRKRRKNDKATSNAGAIAAKATQQMQKIREAERQSKRGELNLPSPQVGEGEIESIVKMGMEGQRRDKESITGEDLDTRGLVGEYSTMINTTPVRTPRVQQEEDRVFNEVRNARLRTQTQSALFGEDNPDIDDGEGTTGYEGVTPSRHASATPNPMATPFRQANGLGAGATPRQGPGGTPMRTPRDSFRLNDQTPRQTPNQTPRELKLAQREAKNSFTTRTGVLPKAAETRWEFEVPDEEVEPSLDAGAQQAEDAAVRDARNAAIRAEEERREFRRQTQVIQRGLPRPQQEDPHSFMRTIGDVADPTMMSVAREAALLTAHDAQKFGGTEVHKRFQLEKFSDEDMERARMEIALELSISSGSKDDNIKAVADSWDAKHEEDDPPQPFPAHFEQVENSMTQTAVDANAVEKRLAKHLGGYQARSKTLRNKTVEAADALEKAKIELETKYVAQMNEEAAISARLERHREEVQTVLRRERAAQDAYKQAKAELEELSVVNGHS